MRRLLLVSLIALAACSKADHSPSDVIDSRSQSAPPPMASDTAPPGAVAPGVSPTAAPGVAFNYRYAFRLPNPRIAAVQEQHAQMCERLGIDRCRITGMRYRLENDHDITAMLAFKLDPGIARQFGKEAIASVTGAEGMLVDSEINGTDASAVIEDANRTATNLSADLAKIEVQLAKPGLSATARQDLQDRANTLRQEVRVAGQTRHEARASLATTPMMFDYGSGSLIPGFSTTPIRDAFAGSWAAFLTMVGFILVAIGALLPWAVIVGAAWWVWRRFGQPPRIRSGAAEDLTP